MTAQNTNKASRSSTSTVSDIFKEVGLLEAKMAIVSIRFILNIIQSGRKRRNFLLRLLVSNLLACKQDEKKSSFIVVRLHVFRGFVFTTVAALNSHIIIGIYRAK